MHDKALPPMPGNAWLRWDLIERLLPEGETLLEIGPGAGSLSARLARRYRYTGVELSGRAAAVTQKRVLPFGGRVIHGSVESVEGKFDIACAFEVLEHIKDDVAALCSWKRHLSSDGHLLLSVPSKPQRWGHNDVLSGHIQRYTKKRLSESIESAGFRIQAMQSMGGPAGYALKWARDLRAGRMLNGGHGSPHEQTLDSGWINQPGRLEGYVWWLLMLPCRWMQRPFVDSGIGTGLVVHARG